MTFAPPANRRESVMNRASSLKRALADVLLLVALTFLYSSVLAVPPVSERPAVVSTRATKAVLLAVTRAGQRLVAVGERGIVLLSDDNGASWRQSSVPVSVSLTGVRFASPQRGWAVGHSGIVLRTQDGGETWTKQLDGTSAARLTLDYFRRKSQSSEGDAEILKRQLADAERLVNDGPDKPFLDLYFSNETTGFVVGAYNLIFRTEDGGESWLPWQDHVDNPRGVHLYTIGGTGSDLYLVGEQGNIFHSADDGRTFTSVPNPYKGSYFGLLVDQTGAVLAFGLRGNAYRSVDRGASWQKVIIESAASLTGGAHLHDGRLILVNQAGQLLMSRDKGMSFQAVPGRSSAPLTAVAQAADGGLVLVGLRGATLFRGR